jgi:plasmid stabilization system protein ParE
MKALRFQVFFTPRAEHDLDRLLDYLLDQAKYNDEVAAALDAIARVENEMRTRLAATPLLYRPAAGGSGLRELVIRNPGGGYVALYDTPHSRQVTVIAVRHPLEDDYL